MEATVKVRHKTQEDYGTVPGSAFARKGHQKGEGQAMTTMTEKEERGAAEDPARLPGAVEALIGARTADAVFVVDPEYRIVHWDAQMESLTGLMAEEVAGGTCHAALSAECEGSGSFCGSRCSVMRLVRAGEAPPSYDMRVSTRWGNKRWVNVSVLSVESDAGPYLIHLMRDSQKMHETLEMARGLIRLSSTRDVPVPDPRDVPALSPRQSEVLGLLAEGKSVKEMCSVLYLSQATVRNHVRSVLQALGAHSQLEALAKARKLGLLSE
ncbi:MAG TPA: LuxR C-terminal-related transcriptional regulator [Rubrobacteraceae bacterium]|nr:LuxR C-terminal-related transcriptional regulator [Rubrobacteraceae bacterium]